MNSLSNTAIIRQKALVETVFESPIPVSYFGPRSDPRGNLYVCSQVGEIIKFNDKGETSIFQKMTGQPTSLVFVTPREDTNLSESKLGEKKDAGSPKNNLDNKEEKKSKNESKSNIQINLDSKVQQEVYYITDVANSVVYVKKEDDSDLKVVMKAYQGIPFKGPTSIAFFPGDQADSLLFCDSGYFEGTSLNMQTGSIFQISLDKNELTPILLNCLCNPSDIFVNLNEEDSIGYVTETFSNRVLRIIRNPNTNSFVCSVFYVFNGRIGPTAVTCDENGNVYVSRFEYQTKEGDVDGVISVINKDGFLIGEIIVPKIPEIVGLYYKTGPTRADSLIYFTARNFNGVKRIKVGTFANDIDKAQDNYKIY